MDVYGASLGTMQMLQAGTLCLILKVPTTFYWKELALEDMPFGGFGQ